MVNAASGDPRAPVTLVSSTLAHAGGEAADARAPLSGDGKRRNRDA